MPASGPTPSSPPPYCGRFAPSPTGALHLGSLVTALGSFLRARSLGGRWLVRIEDLDPPREVAGAGDAILRTLERLGLEWDGEILYQSRRESAYEQALQQLRRQDRVYPCACTRREIAAAQAAATLFGEPLYPGTCRNGVAPGRKPRTWRVRTGVETIRFRDLLQGEYAQVLATDCGDFVVRRADRLFAYQLAVVVDDATQGVSEVVRGCDLLDSTPRQIYLQQLLGLPTPRYAHLPLVLDRNGDKLSKQTGATAIDPRRPGTALHDALRFLGQRPPADLARAAPRQALEWARAHWDLARVPRARGCWR